MKKTIATLMLACAGQMFAGGFWLQLGNPDANPVTLSGTLASLSAISNLDLVYTTSGQNLHQGTSVTVSNGNFSVNVPADCVFTLVGVGSAVVTNSLAGAAGTYHGLFQETDRDHQHSGSFTLTAVARLASVGRAVAGARSPRRPRCGGCPDHRSAGGA